MISNPLKIREIETWDARALQYMISDSMQFFFQKYLHAEDSDQVDSAEMNNIACK